MTAAVTATANFNCTDSSINHREEKGIEEIGGVYGICPLSWSVHHNFAHDGR